MMLPYQSIPNPYAGYPKYDVPFQSQSQARRHFLPFPLIFPSLILSLVARKASVHDLLVAELLLLALGLVWISKSVHFVWERIKT